MLLGATWLVLKTDGSVRAKAIVWALWGLLWVGMAVLAVSLATPLVSETVRLKWFDFPRTLGLMLLPAVTLAVGVWVYVSLRRLKANAKALEWAPFTGAVAIFVLVGALVVVPLIVVYTAFVHRVFWGKARSGLYEQH